MGRNGQGKVFLCHFRRRGSRQGGDGGLTGELTGHVGGTVPYGEENPRHSLCERKVIISGGRHDHNGMEFKR